MPLKELLLNPTQSLPIQLFRYLIIGGTATVVDMGLFYFLNETLAVWYLYATVISSFFGGLTNFSINKFWTFNNTSSKTAQQFFIFWSVAGIGICLNMLVIHLLVQFLSLWPFYAKLISTALVLIWSFLGHKHITFTLLK